MRKILAFWMVMGCGGGTTPISGTDGGGDGSKGAFNASCTKNEDCESNVCYVGDQAGRSFCTFSCTVATQGTDCPNPPTSGMCNQKGYCKP